MTLIICRIINLGGRLRCSLTDGHLEGKGGFFIVGECIIIILLVWLICLVSLHGLLWSLIWSGLVRSGLVCNMRMRCSMVFLDGLHMHYRVPLCEQIRAYDVHASFNDIHIYLLLLLLLPMLSTQSCKCRDVVTICSSYTLS